MRRSLGPRLPFLLGIYERLAATCAGVKELKVRKRRADLPGDLTFDQVNHAANGLNSNPRLLEILLVLLRDPPHREVHDRGSTFDEEVLDAHVSELLFDLRAKLFFRWLLWGRSFHSASL